MGLFDSLGDLKNQAENLQRQADKFSDPAQRQQAQRHLADINAEIGRVRGLLGLFKGKK